MTYNQLQIAATEAANYSDPDAFVSDLLLSSAFLPAGELAQPDMRLAEPLRRTWVAVVAPFRDFLRELGIGQSGLSRRFFIPLRTVQGWALGEREAPLYLRLMIAQLCGYIVID